MIEAIGTRESRVILTTDLTRIANRLGSLAGKFKRRPSTKRRGSEDVTTVNDPHSSDFGHHSTEFSDLKIKGRIDEIEIRRE